MFLVFRLILLATLEDLVVSEYFLALLVRLAWFKVGFVMEVSKVFMVYLQDCCPEMKNHFISDLLRLLESWEEGLYWK